MIYTSQSLYQPSRSENTLVYASKPLNLYVCPLEMKHDTILVEAQKRVAVLAYMYRQHPPSHPSPRPVGLEPRFKRVGDATSCELNIRHSAAIA